MAQRGQPVAILDAGGLERSPRSGRPSMSTRMWRLPTLILLQASSPRGPRLSLRPDRLRCQQCRQAGTPHSHRHTCQDQRHIIAIPSRVPFRRQRAEVTLKTTSAPRSEAIDPRAPLRSFSPTTRSRGRHPAQLRDPRCIVGPAGPAAAGPQFGRPASSESVRSVPSRFTATVPTASAESGPRVAAHLPRFLRRAAPQPADSAQRFSGRPR